MTAFPMINEVVGLGLLSLSLAELLPPEQFYLTRLEAEEIASKLDMDVDTLMRSLIPLVKQRSRPLMTGYQVGIVGKAYPSGNLIFGVNLEFPRQALNQSVHGEQFAIALAHSLGEAGFESFALSAASCGHCRQFINELDSASEIRFLLPNETYTLSELLPRSFGPKDLGIQSNLMRSGFRRWKLSEEKMKNPLIKAAFQAASRSYSPYTNGPAGVAVQIDSGEIFSGSYLENVAFNPSLSPLQSAIVGLVASGKEYSQIRHVVLVERAQQDGISSQIDATQSLLKVLSPDATLERHELESI